MAGGTFITMNKVRPGAYTNMIARAKAMSNLADRGIVAIPLMLDWGEEHEIVKVTAEDILNGNSVALIGTDGSDNLSIQLAFTGASQAFIYRLNAGGTKASASIGDLDLEAKYSGVAGNSIKVSVVANGDKFDVLTYFKDILKDKQTVAEIDELNANDFVVFSGDGDLTANAGTSLSGGVNGSLGSTAYTGFLSALDSYNFNCLAMPSSSEANITATINKIKSWRNDSGKYCQAVVIDTEADDEGIISIKQSFKIGDVTVSKNDVAIYIAAVTAGANVNESNTYRIVDGATEIVDLLTNDEIIESLNKGQLVFSVRQDGAIVIEQDINTLYSFGINRSYAFKKNRVIRTLDEIARTINLSFESNFIGKVTNDDNGRNIFKATVMAILNEFVSLGCIYAVDSEDVEILPGNDIDSVILNLGITPLDSMEKLYTTITVR